MTDDKIKQSSQQNQDFSKSHAIDESNYPKRVRNSYPESGGDGTQETIRNRDSNSIDD